jgi:hypothetical protein
MASIDLSGLAKYTDQLSQALVRESVVGATFITEGNITVIPNVKHTVALNKLSSTLTAQPGGCGIISPASDSVVLSQNALAVSPIRIEESICEDSIAEFYLGMQLSAGSYTEDLSPVEFAKAYTADKLDKLKAFQEDLFFKGSPSNHYSADANLTLTTGILELLEYTSATSSVITGNGTFSANTAMTPANAIAIVDSMISAMNTSASQILNEDDLRIFLSWADFNILTVALRNANYFHYAVGQEENGVKRASFMYPGTNIKIVASRGLNGTNKRILTNAKNLALGCDMVDDYSKFRIWYSEDYNTVFFRSKFKAGAGVYYFQNVVLFK